MLGSIGSKVLNFGVLAILARELGPKAFGIVALASIWTRFLNFFLSQGLGMAIIQRKDLRPRTPGQCLLANHGNGRHLGRDYSQLLSHNCWLLR